MYFTEEKNPKFYRKTKLLTLLEEFRNSGIHIAKLHDWHYVNANVGRNTIKKAARHFGFYGIDVCVNDGEIYLINDSVEKGENNELQ